MIFVGGISGTGKTTAISQFVTRNTAFSHLRASAILRACGRPIKNLSWIDLEENQRILRSALLTEKAPVSTIIDGHFVIPTGVRFFKVMPHFFDGLPIKALVVMQAAPSTILARKNIIPSSEAINSVIELQELEKNQMFLIGSTYNFAVEVVQSEELVSLDQVLLQYGRN